jgi:hypothetical protein
MQRAWRSAPFQIGRTYGQDHCTRREPTYLEAATSLNAHAQGQVYALGDQVCRRIVEQELEADVWIARVKLDQPFHPEEFERASHRGDANRAGRCLLICMEPPDLENLVKRGRGAKSCNCGHSRERLHDWYSQSIRRHERLNRHPGNRAAD